VKVEGFAGKNSSKTFKFLFIPTSHTHIFKKTNFIYMNRRIGKQCIFFTCLLFLIMAEISRGQNILIIKNLQNNTVTVIKNKDYIQCYYLLNQGEKIFLFGNIKTITKSRIILKSGAEIEVERIANIARIPLTKRLILPSIFMGITISILGTSTGSPPSLQILAIAPAIFIVTTYVTKTNRRILKKNNVGSTIDLEIVPE